MGGNEESIRPVASTALGHLRNCLRLVRAHFDLVAKGAPAAEVVAEVHFVTRSARATTRHGVNEHDLLCSEEAISR